MNTPAYQSGRTRAIRSMNSREEAIMNSRRVPRGGVRKPSRSDSWIFTQKQRAVPLLSNKLVIALGGIDLQLMFPYLQSTENPEQRIRVVLRPDSSLSHPELFSTSPVMSDQQTYVDQPQQRDTLSQATSSTQFSTSTPSVQTCSNFLDSVLTTVEERTFLRSMMPTIATPTEDALANPGSESDPETTEPTPLFVDPSLVEYNPTLDALES